MKVEVYSITKCRTDELTMQIVPCNQKVHNMPFWKLKFYQQKQSCICFIGKIKSLWLWSNWITTKEQNTHWKFFTNPSPFLTFLKCCNLFLELHYFSSYIGVYQFPRISWKVSKTANQYEKGTYYLVIQLRRHIKHLKEEHWTTKSCVDYDSWIKYS